MKPSEKQIGGDHYKDMKISVSEYVYSNKLNFDSTISYSKKKRKLENYDNYDYKCKDSTIHTHHTENLNTEKKIIYTNSNKKQLIMKENFLNNNDGGIN